MIYYQDLEDLRGSNQRDPDNNISIQPDDVLSITVTAPEPEAAQPFNLQSSSGLQGQGSGSGKESYLVSDEGTIEFPVVGAIEVRGLTTVEISKKIKGLINDYVKDPIVNVRILNFQISVLGEVKSPGIFTISDDQVNLSKAIAMAGDLTIYGKRKNILVMGGERENKTYAYLDITNANVVNSPHYNLKQNDVVYVEPKGIKRQTASPVGIVTTFLSVGSVIASLIILITK